MDVDPNWFISILYLSAVPSRAIQAEVAQKQNDEEHKVRWNVDVKQLVSELQEQAKKEFEDMAKSIPADEYEDSTTVPSSKSRQRGKKKRKQGSQSEESDDSYAHRGKKPSRAESVRPRGSGGSDGEEEPPRMRGSRGKVWSGFGNIGTKGVCLFHKGFWFHMQTKGVVVRL